MKIINNTSDYIYTREDTFWAFRHAINLGRSQFDGSYEQAFDEWDNEYKSNTLRPITIEAVTKAITAVTGVSEHSIIISHVRNNSQVMARHLMSWFLYVYTSMTYDAIANHLDYKRHTSAIHGYKYINDQLPIDRNTRNMVDNIKHYLIQSGHALYIVEKEYSPEHRRVEIAS